MTKRRHISTKARVALFARKDGVCHICNGKVQPGEAWDVSHPIPLQIGGADDESNWDVAHRKCHAIITATEDIPRIAKMKRQHAKHIGAGKSEPKLRGAGFNKAPPQRRATGTVTKWKGYEG